MAHLNSAFSCLGHKEITLQMPASKSWYSTNSTRKKGSNRTNLCASRTQKLKGIEICLLHSRLLTQMQNKMNIPELELEAILHVVTLQRDDLGLVPSNLLSLLWSFVVQQAIMVPAVSRVRLKWSPKVNWGIRTPFKSLVRCTKVKASFTVL